MSKIELNLGVVSLKNDEDGTILDEEMIITYDIKEDLPYFHKITFVDGSGSMQYYAKDLCITNREDGFTIFNDNTILMLTEIQKSRLFSLKEKWHYLPFDTVLTSLGDRHTSEFAKDFGIVFFYNREINQFVLANLIIDFDWISTQPIILFVTIYDDNRFPIEKVNIQCEKLVFSYKGVIDGMSHYEICCENFLLTEKQIDLLTYISELLSK